jgi:DTW domain-containing protein YfiP
MHHRETYLTSNTATLATLVLPNSQIALRGQRDNPFLVEGLKLLPDETHLYLFPHEDAIDLDAEFMKINNHKKFHLIIPDGTWSQAVKFYRREPDLAGIQCVKLPPDLPGKYVLRKSSDENRLCTYEAIARALGVLEESPELRLEMEKIFDIMIEKVVRGRTAFEN